MSVSVEEAARSFVRRAERARSEREQRTAETLARVQAALLSALPPGARAWLIGSLVWGGFGERSDIDIVISGVSSAAATQIEENVARAAQVQVDLLHFDELPESFRARIEREGMVFRGP